MHQHVIPTKHFDDMARHLMRREIVVVTSYVTITSHFSMQNDSVIQ